jgi:hypothetical protein
MIGTKKDISVGCWEGCIYMRSYFSGINIPGVRANSPENISFPDLQAFKTSLKFFLQIFRTQGIELPCNCWLSHF